MTHVEIANAALALVKTEGIGSFDDDTAQGRACKALYFPTRDKVLEDRVWSFAKKQYVLDAPDAVAPLFYYTKRWALPGDVVLVHRVMDAFDDPDIQWDLQGRFILTGDETELHVTAVRKEEDSSLYSPGFCTALALHLAYWLAIPMAENRQLKADLWDEYQKMITDAGTADGRQGKQERVTSSFLKQRRG